MKERRAQMLLFEGSVGLGSQYRLNKGSRQQVAGTGSSSIQMWVPLPIPYSNAQCVSYKDEILICGGYKTRRVTPTTSGLKSTKRYCENEGEDGVTLLSFGGSGWMRRHVLLMHYESIWNELQLAPTTSTTSTTATNEQEQTPKYKKKRKNQWIKMDSMKMFAKEHDNWIGARALIGGKRRDLLFLTYFPDNIDVLNLNTYQRIRSDTLPINAEDHSISYHCFVPLKTNEFILIAYGVNLLIKYNESQNHFTFESLPLCPPLRPEGRGGLRNGDYGHAYINGHILLFGGPFVAIQSFNTTLLSWTRFQDSLPIALSGCTGVITQQGRCLHIISGKNDSFRELTAHFVIKDKRLIGVMCPCCV
ncbi:hypothetical protein RFI_16460 [Reticulomyxa filosa]|uniref:Kelch motif family protein n=1 Tax=Reticulomyxa filosa TaxID=46433 RepID=X6N3Y5_RETFI|nr:hypothetical protein RFI_16460 [Reticulomyxa filosa]|eukprot:ETO20756.1 hypothetical protein RFI_16460 [Reticulomyxa filosa]